MKKLEWQRNSPLSKKGKNQKETWIRISDNEIKNFEIDLYMGKKTNLIALKKNLIESIKEQLDYYKKSRTKLYSAKEMEFVDCCPITGIKTSETKLVSTI